MGLKLGVGRFGSPWRLPRESPSSPFPGSWPRAPASCHSISYCHHVSCSFATMALPPSNKDPVTTLVPPKITQDHLSISGSSI